MVIRLCVYVHAILEFTHIGIFPPFLGSPMNVKPANRKQWLACSLLYCRAGAALAT